MRFNLQDKKRLQKLSRLHGDVRHLLQRRLVKTGGRLVKHARYYWLLVAESHRTRRLFGSMARRIDTLAVATG
jgi:hypothetical protein